MVFQSEEAATTEQQMSDLTTDKPTACTESQPKLPDIQPSLSDTSSVPSFHEAATGHVKMTPSQELLVQLAEANMDEKDFTVAQLLKT